jgi:hypothetical protein
MKTKIKEQLGQMEKVQSEDLAEITKLEQGLNQMKEIAIQRKGAISILKKLLEEEQ